VDGDREAGHLDLSFFQQTFHHRFKARAGQIDIFQHIVIKLIHRIDARLIVSAEKLLGRCAQTIRQE
jgi:hypothetical protein